MKIEISGANSVSYYTQWLGTAYPTFTPFSAENISFWGMVSGNTTIILICTICYFSNAIQDI